MRAERRFDVQDSGDETEGDEDDEQVTPLRWHHVRLS